MDEEVGTYSSFASRVGRASSEIREVVGGQEIGGMEIEGENNHVVFVYSSSEESDEEDGWNLENETTMVVTPTPEDSNENSDKTTLVIPPEEIQGFLRETGLNTRPRTGIKVKKENGQFLCPICDRPFKRRGRAVSHSYTHMNQLELEKVNIYHQRCPHSPQKIFFTRRKYADHINSHEGIKNYKCQICQKGFGRKEGLHSHMFIHVNQGSQEVEVPFRHIPCYFCQKKFGNMSYLIGHMCVHTKETPFKCSYCNKWFTAKSTMTSHIRRIHTHPDNPPPFPCLQCPKKYHEIGRLTWHIKSVHGEKLHHCPACTKSYPTKCYLDRHVDSVHKKITHQCPHCHKTYSAKSTVMRHINKEHN